MSTQPVAERTVTLTVYAIEAQQVDVTNYGEQQSRYMNLTATGKRCTLTPGCSGTYSPAQEVTP